MMVMGTIKEIMYPDKLLLGLSNDGEGNYTASFDMGDCYMDCYITYAEHCRFMLAVLGEDHAYFDIKVEGAKVTITSA